MPMQPTLLRTWSNKIFCFETIEPGAFSTSVPCTAGLATMWFREVNDICQPMTKERLLTKAGCNRKRCDGTTRLKVRIKDNLNDCEQPAGFKSAEQLSKCGSTVGDFSENGDQDSAIKAVRG
jgi:hypothetical protein